jgi:hypothetical protein
MVVGDGSIDMPGQQATALHTKVRIAQFHAEL